MLDLLALEGRDWQPASTPISKNIEVVDLDVIPKVLMYFLHHTLDTNLGGYELITMLAHDLYLMLTQCPMNIRCIIFADMDEMAKA